MKDYERHILSELLDRYERRSHVLARPAAHRGVFLHFKRETFPDYWIEESPEYRLEINRAALALASQGLIQLDWAPLARGHALARAQLVLERVEAAYARAGRRPRTAKEAALQQVAQGWLSAWHAGRHDDQREDQPDARRQGHTGWASLLLQEVLDASGAHRTLPLGLSLDAPEELDRLCRVVDSLSRLEGEEPRRVFSARVLGDSKELDGRLGRLLVKAATQYHTNAPGLEDPAETWAELGLVDNPQHVLVSGPLVLRHRGRLLHLDDFEPDVGLSTEIIRECTVEGLQADAILTVENLTTYYQTALLARRTAPDQPGGRTLVVYLGGYHNRVRRLLLVKVWEFVRNAGLPARFYHWGDLDLGGFQIFRHLADRTGMPLAPWLMDRETYLAHLASGIPFAAPYRGRLENLLNSPGFAVFHPLLAEMLAHGLRLEQENVRPVLPDQTR